LFVARRGRSELTTLILIGDASANRRANAAQIRSAIDLSTPFVDAMFSDGSRLHVVIPQITRTHLAVKIESLCWASQRWRTRCLELDFWSPGAVCRGKCRRGVEHSPMRRYPGREDNHVECAMCRDSGPRGHCNCGRRLRTSVAGTRRRRMQTRQANSKATGRFPSNAW
jgi:hypothetical protein